MSIKQIVGHPKIGNNERFEHEETLFVSLAEALYMISPTRRYRSLQAAPVKLCFPPTPQDDEAVAVARALALESKRGSAHAPPEPPRILPTPSDQDKDRIERLKQKVRTKTP